MRFQGEEERSPEAAGERLGAVAQQVEPFRLGKPLARGPQMSEGAADEVELRLVLFRVFAVEILLPAGHDAYEEVFWILGFEVVPDALGQQLEAAELAQFLQDCAQEQRVLRGGGGDQLLPHRR